MFCREHPLAYPQQQFTDLLLYRDHSLYHMDVLKTVKNYIYLIYDSELFLQCFWLILLNEENDWDHNVEEDAIDGPVTCVGRGSATSIEQGENRKLLWTYKSIIRVDYC